MGSSGACERSVTSSSRLCLRMDFRIFLILRCFFGFPPLFFLGPFLPLLKAGPLGTVVKLERSDDSACREGLRNTLYVFQQGTCVVQIYVELFDFVRLQAWRRRLLPFKDGPSLSIYSLFCLLFFYNRNYQNKPKLYVYIQVFFSL